MSSNTSLIMIMKLLKSRVQIKKLLFKLNYYSDPHKNSESKSTAARDCSKRINFTPFSLVFRPTHRNPL